MTPEDFATQLQSAYGPALRSVLLYGSAASGEHVAKQSDYNVLVIIDDEIPFDRLREIAAAMRAWRDAGNPVPRTFTEGEWRSSADIFPMEYSDIIERHRVLAGADPCAGIAVDRADLRLQVEREAIAVLLRLRQGVLTAGGDAAEQLKLLGASVSAVMIVFRGVLRLHRLTPPRGYGELVSEVGKVTGVDVAPFGEVVRHVRGEAAIPQQRAGALLRAYFHSMEAVARHVDALPNSRSSEDNR